MSDRPRWAREPNEPTDALGYLPAEERSPLAPPRANSSNDRPRWVDDAADELTEAGEQLEAVRARLAELALMLRAIRVATDELTEAARTRAIARDAPRNGSRYE